MSNLEPTYEDNAKKAGKPLIKFRINRPGAKHFRFERTMKSGVEDRELTMYGGPGTDGIREVWFTADDAKKNQHMNLERLFDEKPVEVTTVGNDDDDESDNDESPQVHIPADWDTLSKRARIDIACQISGRQNIRKVDEADEIIQQEIERRNEE